MKKALFLLFMICLSFSLYPGKLTIAPIEYRDFGNESLPVLNVTIEVDCQAATVTQYVESDGKPVSGAMGFLKYVQYIIPLISSGSTDGGGYLTHQLPGNISFMTGLFTLTVEKNGYRSRELHFDLSGCFVNVTEPETGNGEPPTPPPPPEENGQPETPPPLPEPDPNITPLVNITPNITEPNITINETVNGKPDTEEAPICPLGFAGLVFSVLMVLVARNRSDAN